MEVADIDEIMMEMIDAILKHGNDVLIRRKGDGYVIVEESRVIRAVTGNANKRSKNTCTVDKDVVEYL